jgi:hypothetical protein
MWDINNKNEVCSETIKESIQEILVPIQEGLITTSVFLKKNR